MAQIEALALKGALVEGVYCLTDALHDFEHVGTGLARGIDGNGRFTLLSDGGARAGIAQFDASDVANANARSIASADYYVL